MMISGEQIKLAEELNKLCAYLKNSGDFSFAENDEIASTKDYLMKNYGNLQVGILGFLSDVVNKHPDCEFVFVPSEQGVALSYSYKVVSQVEFDKNGVIVEPKKFQNLAVTAKTND